MPLVFVEPSEVQLHLTLVRRLEAAKLEFDCNEPPQRPVKEQQVEVEVVIAHRDALLARDKREVTAQFKQEALQISLKIAVSKSRSEYESARPRKSRR